MADIDVTISLDDAIDVTIDPNSVPPLITQAEAEAGTSTGERVVTAQRIFQAIAAWITAWLAALTTFRVGTDLADGSLRVTGKAYVDVEAVTFANPLICDCSKSNNHNSTITGDTQIRLSNLSAGMSGMITLLNDGAGAHAVTFGTGFDKKGNGSDDYDATASKYNWINWYYNGVVTVYSITNEA